MPCPNPDAHIHTPPAPIVHRRPRTDSPPSYPPPLEVCPIRKPLLSRPFGILILLPLQHLLERPTAFQSLCWSAIALYTAVAVARSVVKLGVAYRLRTALFPRVALPLLRSAGSLHQAPESALLHPPVHFFRHIDMFCYVAIVGLWGLGARRRAHVRGRGCSVVRRNGVLVGRRRLRAFYAETLVCCLGLEESVWYSDYDLYAHTFFTARPSLCSWSLNRFMSSCSLPDLFRKDMRSVASQSGAL
jgi:hypothetical protein